MEVDDYTHRVGTADQVDVTRYGLGARGIDRIEKTTDAYGSSSVTAVTYPIYDGHGNVVRTLRRGEPTNTHLHGQVPPFRAAGRRSSRDDGTV